MFYPYILCVSVIVESEIGLWFLSFQWHIHDWFNSEKLIQIMFQIIMCQSCRVKHDIVGALYMIGDTITNHPGQLTIQELQNIIYSLNFLLAKIYEDQARVMNNLEDIEHDLQHIGPWTYQIKEKKLFKKMYCHF